MEFDITQFVSLVGLPGTLCILMMTVFRKSLDNNTAAINNLAKQIGNKDDDK